LESQVFVKAQYFRTTRPFKRNSRASSLARTKSLHTLAPTLSPLRLPHDFRAVHPVFHVSMLEPAFPNPIPNRIQPSAPTLIIEEPTRIRNLRNPRYQDLDNDVVASFNILSDGQARSTTKKPLGSMPMSSGTATELHCGFPLAYPSTRPDSNL